MLKINKDIPSFVLSSQLDSMIIATDKEIQFSVLSGGETVFVGVYVPDAHNEVKILDIFAFLEMYMGTDTLKSFAYTVAAEGEATITKVFNVLVCRMAVGCNADYFAHNYFLTTLGNREKETTIGRKEVLFLTEGRLSGTAEPIKVTADCFYVSEQGSKLRKTYNLGTVPAEGVSAIDASPGYFKEYGYRLLRYTVIAGARFLTYRVVDSGDKELGFKFVNSFGLQETFYAKGTVEKDTETVRNSGYLEGKKSVYHISEKMILRVNSGFLPSSMVEFAEDVARSRELYLMGDKGALVPYIIEESSAKHSNEDAELFSLSLTITPAMRGYFPYPLSPEIFDDTFDDTYN